MLTFLGFTHLSVVYVFSVQILYKYTKQKSQGGSAAVVVVLLIASVWVGSS